MTIEQMAQAALKRLNAWINRSVAQRKRRMIEGWK